MITVSIIIPVHNRINITKQGLSSLTDSLNHCKGGCVNVKFEIIVVDDGSTDGSGDWIKRNYPFIHVVYGDGDLWWSGSVNRGVKYALDFLGTDYGLLWNDDLITDKEYFKILSEFLVQIDPVDYILGSRVCYESDKDRTWSVGGYFSKWTGEKFTIRNVKETKGILDCHWQPGMGTLVPKYVMIEKDIWWDEKRYPQYYGDSDFTLKCLEKGIQIKTNLELVIYNRTEYTGDRDNASFIDFVVSLFSIRSFYEIKRNLMFYTQHGFVPFVYYGMVKKYAYYFFKLFKDNWSRNKVS